MVGQMVSADAKQPGNSAQAEGTSQLSLAEECYNGLRSMIVDCIMVPGSRFTEKELISKTGFGRTPVREALARLDIEGLVETLPRSGYRVTEVTAKTVSDMFDVWKLVGPLIVRRASENFSDEQWKTLIEIAASFSLDEPVESTIDMSNRAFELFAEATQNRDLIFLTRRLLSEQRRIYTLYLRTQEGHAWATEQHGLWHDLNWFKDPETAAARISFGIAASSAGIAELIARNPLTVASVDTPKRRSRRAKS